MKVRQQSGASKFERLERAALLPDRRADELTRALAEVARELPAAGTALLRPHPDGTAPLKITYAGQRKRRIERWLASYSDASLEDAAPSIAEESPGFPGVTPVCLPLKPQMRFPGGLWVIWPRRDAAPALSGCEIERFQTALASLVEVEYKEDLYFRNPGDPLDSELARALRAGDEQALPALLTFARMVGDADFTYWGSVHDDTVDVEWHQGARDRGFGFELPIGKGVGGRAFAHDEPLQIPDYRNCQYRYPVVSEITDGEKVRSVLAIPVHSADPQKGAILYAVRRTVDAFSPAEQVLLQRLTRNIEPVPGLLPASRHFFPSGEDRPEAMKSGLRRILLDSNQAQEVESWLERLVRGPAILVDGGEYPYALKNSDRLERLRASSKKRGAPRILPLKSRQTEINRGHLYLWPSVDLPPAGWPDLFEDVAAACSIVIDRMEHSHDRLNHQRSQWLGSVREGKTDQQYRKEGNRLGLPVDRGEVWAIAWDPETARDVEPTRLKMLAEDLALDLLDSPPIFLPGGIGVLLLKKQARKEPSVVRDELLKLFGPTPLWLVHGAAYSSFSTLKDALSQTTLVAERIRREKSERYVSEVSGWGLNSLLENPNLSKDLDAFTNSLLEPLLAYDRDNGSQLTETFCLTLASRSPEEVAEPLFVHANTVRYRMRRAKQILGIDLDSPKEKTAMSLAAFVWLRDRASRPA